MSLGATLKTAAFVFLALVVISALVFRTQVLRSSLDPKQPFQLYRPPPAPDYAKAAAWALLPPAGQPQGAADVFFIHPTTYNGGEDWNGPIVHRRSVRQLDEVMLPNYAGPFARLGRVYAPRYRQASLYAMMSLREDAQEARRFAYADVVNAFRTYVQRDNGGRPFFVVGVEQGGLIADRLVREELSRSPDLKARLAAVYLIQALVPEQAYRSGSVRACSSRAEAGCAVAYMSLRQGSLDDAGRLLRRALVWGDGGELVPLEPHPALCVNPLTGSVSGVATAKANLGAANATGLEWGMRPAFLPRQVSAHCQNGILWVSRPLSPTLKATGGWADRLKAPGYNLFYADLEADARARLKALIASPGFHLPAPPITTRVEVRRSPVMGR